VEVGLGVRVGVNVGVREGLIEGIGVEVEEETGVVGVIQLLSTTLIKQVSQVSLSICWEPQKLFSKQTEELPAGITCSFC
jgi:hypothetical protein